MKKKIIFIFLLFFLILIGLVGSYYLINTYLPKKIKTEIEKAIKNNLNQMIKIQNIKINLIKGITIENIALYEEKSPFAYLKIQKAKVILFYPSLLFKIKFINSIELENVKFFITRYKNNTTNLPVFKKSFQSNENFLVKNISIKNLDIDYIDQIVDFKKAFNNLYIRLTFKKPSNIYFKVNCQKSIEIIGLYNPKDTQLKSKIKIANLNLAEFSPYFKEIKLNNALIKDAFIEIEKEKVYNINGNAFLEYLETEYLLQTTDANQPLPIKYIGPLFIKNFNLKINGNIMLYNISADIKNGNIKNIPKIDNLQEINANFKLDNKNLEITFLKANIDNNLIEANAKIIDFSNPKLYLEGKLAGKISQILQTVKKITEISLPEKLDGDIDLLFNINANIFKKQFNWRIDYILKDAFFLDFKKINSSGYVENDELFLKKVDLFYKEIPIEFSGTLKNITSFFLKKENLEPYLIIKGKASCQLLQFINAIKQIKNFSFDYRVDGLLNLNFKIWGNPKNKFNYLVNYQITNASIADFSNINLYGNVTNDILKLSYGNFQYKNLSFKAFGFLENFNAPTINLSLESQLLNLYLKSFYLQNSLNIKELFVTAPNSKLIAEGKLVPKEFFELKGFGVVSLKDLSSLLKTLNFKSSILEKLALDGLFDISFITRGKPTINALEIKMSTYSQNWSAYNLNFFDTKIQLYKEKEDLIISPIVTYIADGALELKTKLNLKTNKMILNLLLNDIDLSKIRAQLNLKNKRLAGKLSFEGYLENQDFKNPQTLTGNGKIAIKNGNVWEISLLKGLGEFLFIPDFDEIKFTEGKSDLIFKGNNIIFENLNLKSLQMDLEGGGRLSLDGNIHFIVFPHFNPNLISASEGLKKITTHLLGKAGLLVEIEGTIQKPTYKKRFLFLSPKVLENVKNFFRGLLN
ncbi:MAG: hypothetical protein NC918_03290 [Candidatus Omnitrophica bacterium]|nr:hypothetical protein [Candidatus Omnitrophota bacterium]